MPRHMTMISYSSEPSSDLIIDQNLENARDLVYATNITLGGQQFPIQLDTGSSDLWVHTPLELQLTNTTDLPVSLTFGIGQASGNIAFAEMEFGPHKVPSQAFLNATNATNFKAIFSNGINGILGLAFDISSSVFDTTVVAYGPNTTSGLTFMTNVFLQNKTAPNMFTMLLGRANDTEGPQGGAFTISEYVEGLEQVSDEPKLFRTPAQIANVTTIPRWSVQMDSMTVNGQQFQFNQTSVAEADPGKQVVVLDSGFTFSQIPKAAVDFIYSQIPGSYFNATSGLWVMDCSSTIPLSFEFGNKSIPVHPLDITSIANLGNNTVCVNSYRAINLPAGAANGFDFILGDSFLKNVYTSFDYGDLIPGDAESGVPFVQMLAITDPIAAVDEFFTVRDAQVAQNNAKLNPNAVPTIPAMFSNPPPMMGYNPPDMMDIFPPPVMSSNPPPMDVDYSTPTDVPPLDAPPIDGFPTGAPPTDEFPIDAPPTDEYLTDAPPTDAPPLDAPPIDGFPTGAPPTDEFPIDAPPTDEYPTDAPPTDAPPLDAPPIDEYLADAPPTDEFPTDAPPTDAPPTDTTITVYTNKKRGMVRTSRLIIFHGATPLPGMPLRFHHKVMACMNRVADHVHKSLGAFALAVLAGTVGIALISCVVAIALGIRTVLRWRRGEDAGYEPLAIREDVLFDSAGVQEAMSYNRYESVMTTLPYGPRSSHEAAGI
ncbi:aspartic peptidase domain-containing protein [Cytidiella melzeri]|nr:aspartic peptidase domain-containing protein [Cytidiella melzeri]